jgi:hypothetical protein
MSGSYYNAGTDTNYRYGQNQNHPTGPAEFFYGYVTKNDFFFKMCVVAFVVAIMLVVFLAGQSAQLSGGMVVGTILGILIGFYVMAPKTKTDESGEHVHRWWPWGQSPRPAMGEQVPVVPFAMKVEQEAEQTNKSYFDKGAVKNMWHTITSSTNIDKIKAATPPDAHRKAPRPPAAITATSH